MPNANDFVSELVSLCAKHGAAIFARTDGTRQILSVMVGDVWLDFKQIRGDGAEKLD